MAFCTACIWPGRGHNMVRSTIVCKDVCFFYDICTVCVIRLDHWVPVLCCMGAAEMAFCAACIWPGRGRDMVRSTFAILKLCVKMYVFYDICTVCVIRLGHWMPVLCYMGAAEMAFCAACIWPGRGHDMVRSTIVCKDVCSL